MPTPTRTPKNTSSLPKFLLLAALLIILATLGVWVYNTYSPTKKNSTTTSSTAPKGSTQNPAISQTQTPTDTHIFKIPELGIQMTLPAGLEGLEYRLVEDSTDSGHLKIVLNRHLCKRPMSTVSSTAQ